MMPSLRPSVLRLPPVRDAYCVAVLLEDELRHLTRRRVSLAPTASTTAPCPAGGAA